MSARVTFWPQTEGPAVGAVEICSNDADQPVLVVPLEAMAKRTTGATAPSIVVCTQARATSDCEAPHVLDLGGVRVGETASGTVRIQNAGDGVLRIGSARVTGGATPTLVVASEISDVAVLPGEEISVDVTFTPASIDEHQARFTIESSDPIAPSIDVALIGRGTEVQARCGDIAGQICDLTGNGPAVGATVWVAALGGVSRVEVESPGVAIMSAGSGTRVYLAADRFDDNNHHPLMLSFRPSVSSGTVFYTDFHNAEQWQIEGVFLWLIQNL